MRTKPTQNKRDFFEVYSTIRRDWGQVKPVPRIVENGKKKSRKTLKRELLKELSTE